MYIVSAVMRGQLSSLGRGSVVSCRLFEAKQISKIHCQIPTRCHTGRTIFLEGARTRHGQLPNVFLQKRSYNRPVTLTPKYHKDNVPREYEIIYQANLSKRHSNSFIILGALILGYVGLMVYFALLLSGNWEFDEKTTIPGVNITVPTLALQLSCYALTFVIAWTGMCNGFMKLPVQRIYESPCRNKYIGILKKNVFTTERVEFDLSDVKGIRPVKGQILKNGNANIKGRRCLVYAEDFKVPEHFNKLLGYNPVVKGHAQSEGLVSGNSPWKNNNL